MSLGCIWVYFPICLPWWVCRWVCLPASHDGYASLLHRTVCYTTECLPTALMRGNPAERGPPSLPKRERESCWEESLPGMLREGGVLLGRASRACWEEGYLHTYHGTTYPLPGICTPSHLPGTPSCPAGQSSEVPHGERGVGLPR